jgi:hypothetical protein
MSGIKFVRRSVAIGLGALCIILAAGLGGELAYYVMSLNDKSTAYDNYVSAHAYSNTEHESLQQSYDSYVSTHTHNDTEYNALITPRLIGLISTQDVRPFLFGTPSLHVVGNLVNVGANAAYDAVLYVEAFQGSVLTFNTTISLGTISGDSFGNYVDASITYSGSALTKWHVWSAPPGIDWTSYG